LKARIKPGYDQNRQKLSDIVPVSTPFTLFVTPAQVCNFRCNYCTHSLTVDKKKEMGFIQKLQDYDVFLKIAQQAAEFPQKFKRVLLTGLGEPLTNPQIPDMVAELVKLNVADNYEIFTNASLLTQDMSEKLIAAGLTCLRISIQGLTSEKYREVCGANVDFDNLVSNIRYFYENRKSCKVYIKIIDACLENEGEKEKFYEVFGDICDNIFVEHLVNAQPSMAEHYDDGVNNSVTFYGEKAEKREVCPYIFYTLQTDAMGNVFPCPPLGLPMGFSLGNIKDVSLKEIWNGRKLKDLRILHLKKCRNQLDVCGTCDNYMCFTPKEDNLDDSAEEIINRLNAEV
jgi:MoaA/NifB/PqqE/SkfB family radical SAM enzyme